MITRLTERRKQFLTKLIQIYEKTGAPVHYEDLARSLSVSKWTAYEVIRALRKEGLTEPVYEGNGQRPGPGRWRVHFVPTAKALGEVRAQVVSAVREEWRRVEASLLRRLQDAGRDGGAPAVLRALEGEMDVTPDSTVWCAYGVVYLTVAGAQHSRTALSLGLRMLRSAPGPLAGMLVYTSSLVGALTQLGISGADRVAERLPALLARTGADEIGWLAGLARRAAGEMGVVAPA
ncbi:MAG: hypothetical protein IMW99_04760 [Firmicutes bacterium]|nr:hypothetical protein [Bacillota bacterium]